MPCGSDFTTASRVVNTRMPPVATANGTAGRARSVVESGGITANSAGLLPRPTSRSRKHRWDQRGHSRLAAGGRLLLNRRHEGRAIAGVEIRLAGQPFGEKHGVAVKLDVPVGDVVRGFLGDGAAVHQVADRGSGSHRRKTGMIGREQQVARRLPRRRTRARRDADRVDVVRARMGGAMQTTRRWPVQITEATLPPSARRTRMPGHSAARRRCFRWWWRCACRQRSRRRPRSGRTGRLACCRCRPANPLVGTCSVPPLLITVSSRRRLRRRSRRWRI